MNKELKLIKDLIRTELSNNLEKKYELPDNYEQRSIGDRYEGECVKIIKKIVNDNIIKVIERRSKKSLEDVTVITENYKIYIDPKTIDISPDLPESKEKKFSMPNLTAIRKLKKEIFDSVNTELLYVSIKYTIKDNVLNIEKILLFYVWELDLKYTRFGNLGKGQLQIKDARKDIKLIEIEKKQWWAEFLKKIHKEYIFILKQNIIKEVEFWK